MSNSFLEVCGVRCYEEDGVAYLHIEDVARGLGFTQNQIKNGVNYTSVRWERLEGFLDELDFPPQVGENKSPHDYYIPENIFYRLCMKANNAFAKNFQEKVANEVLPKLRKHGVYMTDNVLEQTLNNPDFLINILQEYKKEKAEKEKAIAERDEAIRTKTFISSKREATAMATAKAEKAKRIALEERIGEGTKWMSSAQLIKNYNITGENGKPMNSRSLTLALKKRNCTCRKSDVPDKSGYQYTIFLVSDALKALKLD